MTELRYAIVMKAHAWDGFIARQFERYRDTPGAAEVFLYLDETNGRIADVPLPNVIRATNDDLYAIGLGPRFERGSLLWWNTDYPHYLFHRQYPDYDYVLFVEYDTCCLGDVDAFVRDAASRQADLVALPTRQPKDEWIWTRFHAQTYDRAIIEGSLNCVSLYSKRALDLLSNRRIAMADEARNGTVPFWPGNEVFLATEIRLAGYRFMSLAEFGDVSKYEWHPPILEADVASTGRMTFLHPVLDQKRYIGSLLKFAANPLTYFRSGSVLRRELARFPESEWRPQLVNASWMRLRTRARERREGLVARLQNLRPSTNRRINQAS